MTEEEIIKIWKKGMDKYKVAEIYKRMYNQQIKLIRLETKNHHARQDDKHL